MQKAAFQRMRRAVEQLREKCRLKLRRLDDVARLAGCRFDAVTHVDQMLFDSAQAADNVVEFLLDGDGLGPIGSWTMRLVMGIVSVELHGEGSD
ncbi:MAG: hypothetical protein JWM57_74 [Phycisphaerales bacterium]|nr:hypothetical protein [Phycisphaerales bacterium]